MHPLIGQWGPFSLRWYGLAIAIGILCGAYLANRRAARLSRHLEERVYEFAFYAVLGGVVGARLWEVIFTWRDYVDNPWDAIAFWKGGMSIQGAILGGLLVTIWFVRKYSLNFWTFADVVAPGLILGQALGRAGCFMNGDAYGVPAPPGAWYGVMYAPGTPAWYAYGPVPLIPAEALEGLLDLVVLAILLLWRPKKEVQGRVFCTYVLLYGVERYFLEYLRGDSLLIGSVKVQQVVSAVLAIAAAVLLVRQYRVGKPPELPADPAPQPAVAPQQTPPAPQA